MDTQSERWLMSLPILKRFETQIHKLKEDLEKANETIEGLRALGEVYIFPNDWDWPGMGRGPNFDECDTINLKEYEP